MSYKASSQITFYPNKKDISLFNRHLASRRSNRGHVILNSIDEIDDIKLTPHFYVDQDFDSTFTPESATFTVKAPGTDVRIQKTFHSLTDIKKQNVIKWISDFKNIASLCAWNEEVAKGVLRTLLGMNYQQLLGDDLTIIQ